MRLSSTPIVFSGASGMLGSALRSVVLAAGAQVVQLVRRPPVSPAEIEWQPAAASQPLPAAERLEGVSAACHLSGANLDARRWTPAFRRELVASRVGSTRALAVALAGLRHPPRVLLAASAIGFYGNRGSEPLTEASAPGAGFMADLCQQWEAAAQPAVEAGIRVVHLRLGIVLGPGGALARMLPVFRLGLGGPLGSGRQWMSWIALEDAVAAMRFALETETLTGPVNLTAPAPATNAEFTRALARALHRPAVLPAPAFALRLALGEMADEALLASARVLPAKLASASFVFRHPALDQALAVALTPHALS